jgi:hypothetical protein
MPLLTSIADLIPLQEGDGDHQGDDDEGGQGDEDRSTKGTIQFR